MTITRWQPASPSPVLSLRKQSSGPSRKATRSIIALFPPHLHPVKKFIGGISRYISCQMFLDLRKVVAQCSNVNAVNDVLTSYPFVATIKSSGRQKSGRTDLSSDGKMSPPAPEMKSKVISPVIHGLSRIARTRNGGSIPRGRRTRPSAFDGLRRAVVFLGNGITEWGAHLRGRRSPPNLMSACGGGPPQNRGQFFLLKYCHASPLWNIQSGPINWNDTWSPAH